MPNITRQIVLLIVQVQRARQNAENKARKSALCHIHKLSILHSKHCFSSAVEKSLFSRVLTWIQHKSIEKNKTKQSNYLYPVSKHTVSHINQLTISNYLAWNLLREKYLDLNNLKNVEVNSVFSKHGYLGRLPTAT